MTSIVDGAMRRTIMKLVLEVAPCRVVDVYKHVEYVDCWGHLPRMYRFEINDAIMELFNDRVIDINFDSKGHPWIVYSNWSIVCPIVSRR
jgi:hypothetical protein